MGRGEPMPQVAAEAAIDVVGCPPWHSACAGTGSSASAVGMRSAVTARGSPPS